MSDDAVIAGFTGEHAFLSNFHPSPLDYEGLTYPTVEHAFQAAKSTDAADRLRISLTAKPGQAKRLGRRVALRPDWERVKLGVMLGLLRLKFERPELRQMLRETGSAELIEVNGWGDRYWGQDRQGNGQNHLGELLVQVRGER